MSPSSLLDLRVEAPNISRVYIKELQLTGFKSFQEKTTLRFSAGMNAIIGPNGCGKTNILDALRWVLGEQSFNLLRCGKTEDLIFGGTAQVPATNYADVRLVLANDSLPEYPAEIEIRRRFFRTGESEYYLNRQSCRQKDIQEVFLASGMGTKAYSIFDLRQMREIIAGNIRKMFEEAATLAKYQDAKADCERKLALTEADLTRLNDIIAERERVVRSLRYQAGKQRSWEKLKEEEKGYRLVELKHEFTSVSQELEHIQKDTESLEQADAERLTQVSKLDEELHRQRGRLRQEQSLKDELAGQAQELRARLTELEGRVLLGSQKAQFLLENARQYEAQKEELAAGCTELEQVLDRSLAALAGANAELEKLEQALEQAQADTRATEDKLFELRSHEQAQREALAGLVQQQQELRSRLVRAEAVSENLAESAERSKTELAEVEEKLTRCREDEEQARTRVSELAAALDQERKKQSALEAEVAQSEQERSRVHAELAQARDRGHRLEKELAVLASALPDREPACSKVFGDAVTGEVSRFVSVEKGWEKACEAALQPLIEFVVMQGEPSSEALGRLAGTALESWCGLLPAAGLPTAEKSEKAAPEYEGIVGRLSDFAHALEGAPAALRSLVDSFLVVDEKADLAVVAKALPAWCLVNRLGWARFSDGRYVIAAQERGRLRVTLLKSDKTKECEESASLVRDYGTRERELEARRTELDRQLEEAREAAAGAGREKLMLDARLEGIVAKRQELEHDKQRIQEEAGRLGGDAGSNRQSSEAAKAELTEVSSRVEQLSSTVSDVETRVREKEQETHRSLERAAERLAAVSEQRQRASRLEADGTYARRQLEERRKRVAELEGAIVKAGQEAESLTQESVALRPEVEKLRRELEAVESRMEALKVTDLASVEEELERNLAELRKAREQNRNILMEQRMRQHELRQRRQAIEEEARTDYKTGIAGFEPTEVEDVVNRLAQVRQRIAALGAVNPLASEDYQRDKEDLERIISQRDDVVAARDNLVQTMLEIDRHAKDRFMETYEQVRTHFREIFRQMFLEGDADLSLVDESKPLESEVAIFAKPRGKTPKRLEQLSDGEKALLAVSLLFAFYRVKPAPFCFLDEIDAPLDDANVGRFSDYLKALSDKTQVIVITHNRLTVERAEALFGVTAEQPGISTLISVSLADYRSSPAAAAVS